MFTDVVGSAMSGRNSSFRRPELGGSGPATPTPETKTSQGKYDSLRLSSQGTPSGLAHTPIPSVMTPSASLTASLAGSGRALSPSSLNRLQAKVLRAKLMKRSVPVDNLDYGKVEAATGRSVRQVITIKQGIEVDKAKEIVKFIKDTKMKVQASIQGDVVRVSGKSRDDL